MAKYPGITYVKTAKKKTSLRCVYLHDSRIGDVENYGRKFGWHAYGNRDRGYEHKGGFKTRAKASRWLVDAPMVGVTGTSDLFRVQVALNHFVYLLDDGELEVRHIDALIDEVNIAIDRLQRLRGLE